MLEVDRNVFTKWLHYKKKRAEKYMREENAVELLVLPIVIVNREPKKSFLWLESIVTSMNDAGGIMFYLP